MSRQPKHSPVHSEIQDASVEYIAAKWPLLPPHVREAILTVIDAVVTVQQRTESQPSSRQEELKF